MQDDTLLENLEEFVKNNEYSVDENQTFLSRDIDGRYEKKDGLEPLAKPGGDLGDLMMMVDANEEYGLGLEMKDMVDSLIKTIGGWKNFRYVKRADFALDEMPYVLELLKEHENEIATTPLVGDHREKAILIVKSDTYSVYPQNDNHSFQVFVYQKTLDNKRRRVLANHLLPLIKMDIQITEEYLYEVLSQIADNQFLDVISRVAKQLPIYEVSYKKDEFEIENITDESE